MARNSLYGKLLGSVDVPDWVFGGEYGDITKLLAARDIATENARQVQQQTMENDLLLDKKRRISEYDESLGDIFAGDSKPQTIRDMYNMQMGKALESGNADIAAQMQQKIFELEEDERKQKQADLNNALNLAPKISTKGLEKLYPGVLDPAIAQEIYNNSNRTRPAKEKTYDMKNPRTGDYQPDVPASEAASLARQGYFYMSDTLRRGQEEQNIALGEYDAAETPSKEMLGGGFLTPYVEGPVNQARGDRTRQQPPPQAQVRKIIRSRAIEE